MTPQAGQPSVEADAVERFSLVVGGPFHAVLRRVGWTDERQLPTVRAAIYLALLAWVPIAALVIAQSLADADYSGWRFFTDWSVYARYLVAIAVMIATERYADARLLQILRHFRRSGLVPDASAPAFAAAVALADRRSSSTIAETVILLFAVGFSNVVVDYIADVDRSSWEATASGVGLSWAGMAAPFWSNALFQFLALRWLWRFLVWTMLLFRVSRLPLRLSPLHPDRAAGLGFLAVYPGTFSGFVFAMGCAVGSSILKDLAVEVHAAQIVWTMLGSWIGLAMVLFLGPLLVFARPLYDARERALLDYGRLATQHHLAFQAKWIDTPRSGAELMGSGDASAASDLNAIAQIVAEMKLAPVDRPAVVQLLLAAGIPMLPVVAVQMSLLEALGWIVGTIL